MQRIPGSAAALRGGGGGGRGAGHQASRDRYRDKRGLVGFLHALGVAPLQTGPAICAEWGSKCGSDLAVPWRRHTFGVAAKQFVMILPEPGRRILHEYRTDVRDLPARIGPCNSSTEEPD